MKAGLGLTEAAGCGPQSGTWPQLALHLCILLQREQMYFFNNYVQYSHNLSL